MCEWWWRCLQWVMPEKHQHSTLWLLLMLWNISILPGISCCYSFQIWFYTNDIFKNAGIPEPYIQYTTVGTGAIEVISGMLGVRSTPYLTQSHDIIHPINMRWYYYTWLMSICNSLIHSNWFFCCCLSAHNQPINGICFSSQLGQIPIVPVPLSRKQSKRICWYLAF